MASESQSYAPAFSAHIFAAHIRVHYQSLAGRIIDSIRPFGKKTQDYLSTYKYSPIVISPGEMGLGIPYDYDGGGKQGKSYDWVEYVFPNPRNPSSFIIKEPWIAEPDDQTKHTPFGTMPAKKDNLVWQKWTSMEEDKHKEAIQKWLEDEPEIIKQQEKPSAFKTNY